MKNGLSAISIPMLDEEMGRQVKGHVDSLTVPQGSLGRLEEWIIELAKMTGRRFRTFRNRGDRVCSRPWNYGRRDFRVSKRSDGTNGT